MALADEVQARYSSAQLVRLTNPNVQAASSINSTRLGQAVTDVEADFLIYTATDYDNTDARHVAVAVQGVIAYLRVAVDAPGEGADGLFTKYIDRLQQLAKVTGRDRIRPRSKSVLTPTPERRGTEIVRPDTDRPMFDDVIPGTPSHDDPRIA